MYTHRFDKPLWACNVPENRHKINVEYNNIPLVFADATEKTFVLLTLASF
jgi:hypothetical protein